MKATEPPMNQSVIQSLLTLPAVYQWISLPASRGDLIFWNYFIMNFIHVSPALDVLVKPLGLLSIENCWVSPEGPRSNVGGFHSRWPWGTMNSYGCTPGTCHQRALPHRRARVPLLPDCLPSCPASHSHPDPQSGIGFFASGSSSHTCLLPKPKLQNGHCYLCGLL